MGARLGQHFLKNPYYAKLMADECRSASQEIILEIGPGTGALTKELLATGKKLVAIEKDEALAENLKNIFPLEISSGQLRLIVGDVRNFKPVEHSLLAGSYTLAANIPYYITGEIIRNFLTTPTQPAKMLLIPVAIAIPPLPHAPSTAGRSSCDANW